MSKDFALVGVRVVDSAVAYVCLYESTAHNGVLNFKR